MPTVSQTLVKALGAQGVTRVFCVPGESYLAVLDALYDARDDIDLITCRHEAAATNMAEAEAKLTGRAGVAMVTRGPGATHASIGIHTAFQDSTPLVLFVGDVGTDMAGREAFQEIDYNRYFGSFAKAVIALDRPARTPELLARAFALAVSGRPGPVVVTLPEDLLLADAPPALAAPALRPEPSPDAGAVAQLAAMLETAERPVLWLGGPDWTADDREHVRTFAEAANVSVVTSWRRKAHFDNGHSHYAGELGLGANPTLVERVTSSDLIIALGTRLGEVTSLGYTLPAVPQPGQPLVHIHPDAGTLGDVRRPALAIQSSSRLAAKALAEVGYVIDGSARTDWVASARADYEDWTRPTDVESGVNPAAVIHQLSEALPSGTVFANGAGNFAGWLHRFHHHREVGTQLAPTSGAMGYGVPAAIAAALVTGNRSVCVAGDGDFLMSGSELATAVRYGAKTLFVVMDNGQLGTIRMHQERDFPGRQSGTGLTNPDFAAYAASFGVPGWTVERTEDFAAALREALAVDGPALICCRTDPSEIAPGRRI
ncbi:thiamine pyrophosphate-binding protein [Pacificimonas flava]|uniref:Thiamine pyrophosphate-binding protein n=2 Tax=Pacificimonas TaxID=1960290 RepID=A0A219B4H4_9SPHN|nr:MULTISPECIES: thiamine pyrophosphate-dependent enzyme [Pacificimonas]MBZ6377241.1 thiamine pyrophosphate-binding protein [Pacificimonas aurantium]OWV33043.1 thiamine pyrophosphate-binding protein [Pacificimonas flava]